MNLDRVVTVEKITRLPRDEGAGAGAELTIHGTRLNTILVRQENKFTITREQLDRLARHISRLNEIMARQEARALRLGWPGIAVGDANPTAR